MGKWGLVLAVILALARATRADEPGFLLSPPDPGPASPAQIALPPVADSPAAAEPLPPVGTELLIGFPVALRTEMVFAREGRAAFSAEAVAGLYIVVPFVGAGGRVLWTAFHGPRNAFLVVPGLEVDYVPKLGGLFRDPLLLVTPDMELLWMHEISPGLTGTIGADLGAGVSVNHGSPAVVPRVSLSLGMRF